ncbi:hypothetical protein [Inquilinus limosus]|uniref:Uncharacterized protein n=1 Tax=Inquilinus limosus MP06 TaxID=1398085 RepID=A0A0A0DE32_9PROT|nr:hypothetical protein [Inquilinus limosus]KGM36158.1 hypothetical protein P409_00485 [Inquilinus limosus MP06]
MKLKYEGRDISVQEAVEEAISPGPRYEGDPLEFEVEQLTKMMGRLLNTLPIAVAHRIIDDYRIHLVGDDNATSG